jgi:hypothetical protein
MQTIFVESLMSILGFTLLLNLMYFEVKTRIFYFIDNILVYFLMIYVIIDVFSTYKAIQN